MTHFQLLIYIIWYNAIIYQDNVIGDGDSLGWMAVWCRSCLDMIEFCQLELLNICVLGLNNQTIVFHAEACIHKITTTVAQMESLTQIKLPTMQILIFLVGLRLLPSMVFACGSCDLIKEITLLCLIVWIVFVMEEVGRGWL